MGRTATRERATNETIILLKFDLDGSGRYAITTGIPFLDHMLNLFAAHSLCDLEITAAGDTHIDDHHTVEDIGLCLGDAFAAAMGEKKGMVRYGFFILPMDEALAEVALDFSGRPYLAWNVAWEQEKIKSFDVSLVEEFWRAFAMRALCTMHICVRSGKDAHHVCEAIFKSAARAVDAAVRLDSRRAGVPSTKGTLTQ